MDVPAIISFAVIIGLGDRGLDVVAGFCRPLLPALAPDAFVPDGFLIAAVTL